MEGQRQRVVAATAGFAVATVVILAGVGAALECVATAAGCFGVTAMLQRRTVGRRLAQRAWHRRRLNELDHNLSQRRQRVGAERQHTRPTRSARTAATAPALFDLDERGDSAASSSYGW